MKKYLLLSSLIGFFGVSYAQIQLQRDPSFGNNGIFTYNQGNGYGAKIFIQNDNSLLLTNDATDLLPNRYVVKINPDGMLDNSFAQNGYLQLDNSSDTFHALLQGDGSKFYINYADPYTSPINNRIISYNTNGTVNSSFSNNGALTYNFSIQEGYFTSTEDGGLLLTKYDGFTKYLQTGGLDAAVGTNGSVTFDNSGYPIEPIETKDNKLFFDNFAGTKRVDVHTSSIVEKQAASIYLNPIALYENYRTKAKDNYSLYYFRFTNNSNQLSGFTSIRLMKTDENLTPSAFGNNPYINLPINPNVYNNSSTDVIYTPNGNYLIFGYSLVNGLPNFLAYNEMGNQVNVNSQQFFTDSGISPYLSYVKLYSKGNVIYMVSVTGNNISVVKYNITENQPTLSTIENSEDDIIVVNNPFGDSITAKDEKESILKMDLYSYSGALILSTNKKEMSTLNIPKGGYILKITTKKGLISKKLIKID